MKPVIILGSSRRDGHTRKAVDELNKHLGCDIIDLADHRIGHYDYEHNNVEDDFLPLIQQIIEKYDLFIFATPVYWYTMSGVLKVFIDRLTDLLDAHQTLGRQLRVKHMVVVTSSLGDHLGEDFWLPFIHTASYLGMQYQGGLHTVSNRDNDEAIHLFAQRLKDTLSNKDS